MSYTFSRRDFMKYTALTAVAIAGSGMLTGCVNQQHFQVNVTDADNKLHTYYQGVSGVTIDLVGGSNASVDAKTTVTPTLKVSGIENLTSASKVQVLYIPKMYANGSITDSYSDIYATWDITDAIKVTIVD